MSATNRGSEREENDRYNTPDWLVEAVMPWLVDRLPAKPRILEPACGEGAIVNVLRAKFPDAEIVATDIITGTDFLTHELFEPATGNEGYDLIMTNPPFSYAMQFIQRGMELRRTPKSIVMMLLRLNFLGSQGRAKWLRAHTPTIHVTPKRPSFVHGGNDNCEYAWMAWDGRWPSVFILETEDLDIPRTNHNAAVKAAKSAISDFDFDIE